MRKYGWYITIIEVAKTGLFNRTHRTAIESAEKANLYEVMTYLSLQADIAKVKEMKNRQQQIQQRGKRKR